MSGAINSFFGHYAGFNNTTGYANTFFGKSAGYANVSGSENTFIGRNAGTYNTIGQNNVFVGSYAASSNTTGSMNVVMGAKAAYRNGNADQIGNYNVMIGDSSGFNNTSSRNVYVGSKSGYSNKDGGSNTFVGSNSGYSNTFGGHNVLVGYNANYDNTSGSYNSSLGDEAGRRTTSGTNNTFLGSRAGFFNTVGEYNTYVGFEAGDIGPNMSSLKRATSLGYNALVGVDDGVVLGDTMNAKIGIGTAYPNQKLTLRGNINFVAYDNSLRIKNLPFLHWDERDNLALGLGSTLDSEANNTLVLGNTTTRVGFGTSTPMAEVEINSGMAGVGGLRLTQLSGSDQNTQFLTVDSQGQVVLVQPRVKMATPADWADRVFEKNYSLLPLKELDQFVRRHKHLPGIPSAQEMAEKGIDSSVLLAKQMEKIEELTLYVIELEKKVSEVDELRALLIALKKKLDAQK